MRCLADAWAYTSVGEEGDVGAAFTESDAHAHEERKGR